MQKMYRDINAKVAEPGAKKKAVTFRAAYQKMRKARRLKTMKEPEGEQYKVTFQRELQDWIYQAGEEEHQNTPGEEKH